MYGYVVQILIYVSKLEARLYLMMDQATWCPPDLFMLLRIRFEKDYKQLHLTFFRRLVTLNSLASNESPQA